MLKYKIRSILGQLSPEMARQRRHAILHRCRISERTFRRWQNIGLTSMEDIPAQSLDTIAALLKVTPETLKNYCITITNDEENDTEHNIEGRNAA